MSEMAERLERMERQVRVLSRWVVGLGVVLVAGVTLGAACPQELTLRRLIIVDDSGRERIVLGTFLDNSTAAILHYDRDGKQRIGTGTLNDGQASIEHFDRDGKKRIITGTLPNGQASILHYDRDGKRRIATVTFDDGNATIHHFDRDGKTRIAVGTLESGAAVITLDSSKGEHIWTEQSE